MSQSQEVPVSADEILEAERKERPLLLDPIVIASFGDFHAAFKTYLNYSLCKVSGCTAQSKPPSVPGVTQTGTSSETR